MGVPIILLTADRRALPGMKPSERVRPHRPEVFLGGSYVEAVRRVGGTPLLLPPGPTEIEDLLSVAHGVVLTGGHFDIHPRHYGQSVTQRLDRVVEDRTELELKLARYCLAKDIPVLGICGGMQLLAVAAGGSLIQDLPGPPEGLAHEQPSDPATAWHPVRCEAPLDGILGTTVQVNSTHHQAVDDPGQFAACGFSNDGVIEGIALPGHRFAVGVQWHPELLGDDRLYEALLRAVSAS